MPRFRPITRIVVRTNQNVSLREITDRGRIESIQKFMFARRAGWAVPFAGPPVPTRIAELYHGQDLLAHFGAGENFFSALFGGEFHSRLATPEELAEFARLIGEPGPRTPPR